MGARSVGRVGVERLHGRDEHVDAHDHAAAAAVGRVVDAPVLAEAEVARAAEANRHAAPPAMARATKLVARNPANISGKSVTTSTRRLASSARSTPSSVASVTTRALEIDAPTTASTSGTSQGRPPSPRVDDERRRRSDTSCSVARDPSSPAPRLRPRRRRPARPRRRRRRTRPSSSGGKSPRRAQTRAPRSSSARSRSSTE